MEQINKVVAWDSPGAALKLILGLFLFVGLWSFFVHGIRTFQLLRTAHSNTPEQRELSTLTQSNARGFIEVSGYVGKPISSTFIDPFSSLTPRTTNYYPLYSEVSQTSAPQLFVREGEGQVFEENARVTVKGTVGIEKLPRDLKEYKNIPLLVLADQAPQMSRVLMWFIPVSIGFFVGLFFVLQWVIVLKSQFFGKH